MKGKIIRVSGKFKATGLPKLSEYDISLITSELINHRAVECFFDFSDIESMTILNGKVLEIVDQKNGERIVQPDEGLAPEFAKGIFNGVDGVKFKDSEMSSVENFYRKSMTRGTLDMFVYPASDKGDGNSMITSLKGNTGIATYIQHNAKNLSTFSGNAVAFLGNIVKHTHIMSCWDFPKIIAMQNEVKGSAGSYAYSIPSDKINVGRWNDESAPNYFDGYIGHIILLNADASADDYLLELLNEYSRRKYRQ